MASSGPSTGDATLRRRIEPWEFESYFDPRQLRKETCLFSEIHWSSSPNIWRSTSLNTTNHVEINFIQKFTTERYFRPSVGCCITWYLSWSPCGDCCQAIGDFLSQYPNVNLNIYVARLYYHSDHRNRQGLRDLYKRGVKICTMSVSEYCYCWSHFVNHPPGMISWPAYPHHLWTMLYTLELYCIVLDLPPCLKISRICQKKLTLFQLNPQNCHYRSIVIPPQILSAIKLIYHPAI